MSQRLRGRLRENRKETAARRGGAEGKAREGMATRSRQRKAAQSRVRPEITREELKREARTKKKRERARTGRKRSEQREERRKRKRIARKNEQPVNALSSTQSRGRAGQDSKMGAREAGGPNPAGQAGENLYITKRREAKDWSKEAMRKPQKK